MPAGVCRIGVRRPRQLSEELMTEWSERTRTSGFSRTNWWRGRDRGAHEGLDKLALTLADQGLISLVNFATALLIGRVAGVEHLGVYTLCFTILLLFNAASEALVTSPFMVVSRKLPRREVAAYFGSVFVIQAVLLAAAVAAVLSFAVWSMLAADGPDWHTTTFVFAAALPLIASREFVRRISLSMFRPAMALVVDGTAAIFQMVGLAVLALRFNLDVTSAFVVIALASAIALVPWIFFERPATQIEPDRITADVRRHSKIGIWNLAAVVTFVLSLYMAPWLLGALGTAADVGLFAACIAIVMFTNPAIQGIANYLMPRFAEAVARHQHGRMRSLVSISTVWLCILATLLALPLVLFGGKLLTLAFGPAFAGHGATVAILSIAVIARSTAMPAYIGLWVSGRSQSNAAINVVGLSVLAVGILLAMPTYGLVGVALATLVADLSAGILRIVTFRHLSGKLVAGAP